MSGRLRYAMKVSLPKCVLKKSYYRFYLPVNLDKKYYGFLIKKKKLVVGTHGRLNHH